MLLGDGAQRIYAGGFKLRQAGVEVRGRTTVLRTNYRNTAEIIGAAMAVAGGSEVDDLAEEFRRGEAEAASERHGGKPLLVEATDLPAQLDVITARVGDLADRGLLAPGDVGVLVPTNKLVEQAVARLKQGGVNAQELDRYDGRPNDLVKVGTYHRGKGLEFKAVFLPGLSAGEFPRPPSVGQSPEEAAEANELALSQLFVAMTRARDLLVLLYSGQPSEVIAASAEQFQLIGA